MPADTGEPRGGSLWPWLLRAGPAAPAGAAVPTVPAVPAQAAE